MTRSPVSALLAPGYATFTFLASPIARAQDAYPAKSLRNFVPIPPGRTSDIFACVVRAVLDHPLSPPLNYRDRRKPAA